MADSSGPTWVEKIKPYPRKHETSTMEEVNELTLISGLQGTKCRVRHNAPALVFSAGGYTGNFFHDFNDGFIPIYIIVNLIMHDQDPVLVISDVNDWWIERYSDLLHRFRQHSTINLDNDTATHCFRSAMFGLISRGYLTIKRKLLKPPKILPHFHAKLGEAFGQTVQHYYYLRCRNELPQMVLISRSVGVGGAILNQKEVIEVAERIMFEVIVYEPSSRTDLHVPYDLLSNSHAIVGVHGAARTHLLFMQPGTVFVQIIPLATQWLAKVCYENPSRAMGLEYINYRITDEESSLVKTYDIDDIVVRDPAAKIGPDWSMEVMKIYLKEQNVLLDLDRFSGVLKAAYDEAKKIID